MGGKIRVFRMEVWCGQFLQAYLFSLIELFSILGHLYGQKNYNREIDVFTLTEIDVFLHKIFIF